MSNELPRHEELVEERLVFWYFLAALGFMFVSMLGGLLMAIQLQRMNPLRGTRTVLAGSLANDSHQRDRLRLHRQRVPGDPPLVGAAVDVEARIEPAALLRDLFRLAIRCARDGRRHPARRGTGPGMGRDSGLDRSGRAARVVPGRHQLHCADRQDQRADVRELWYFLAALVWTFLTYAMGNFIPQYFVSGTSAGAVGGLFIHDLVGLFVTPLGWGMVYYFVPILLKKPIWSHGLSLVGFWGLAFFYPLTGIHHFLYTPIPMFLQYGAIISTIAVELVVTTVIINFHMTLRGSPSALTNNMPIRWLYTGMAFYFLTCLQCAFQTTLTFQALIHFTDWVVGHAHMVMFGVFGMWLLGVMTYLIPRLLKTAWYSERLLEWHYWLSTVGIGLMAFDLIALGVFQGLSWSSLMPWDVSIDVSIPFWAVRLVAGLLMFTGFFVFMFNMAATWITSRAHRRHREELVAA